jgi:pyrimidine-specific ribonucleoside hydrolase
MNQRYHPAMGPMIVDSDAGTDPDDTCVAILVARHPALFDAALLVSNDETTRFAKARFLRHVVELAGGTIPVAAGLPSLKQRTTDLADDAGLVPDIAVDANAVERIIAVLEAHPVVDYVGLGALTNLDAVFLQRPDLIPRVRLTQMGPAVAGNFARERAQYNARVDPMAFRRVLHAVSRPTLIATHTTWGVSASHPTLGVFPGDEIGSRLAPSGRPDLLMYAQHLAAFVASGKDCSILHDPTTLLVTREPELVDVIELEVVLDEQGWLHLTADALDLLRLLPAERTALLATALAGEPADGDPITVRLSLGANHPRIRERVAELLFT